MNKKNNIKIVKINQEFLDKKIEISKSVIKNIQEEKTVKFLYLSKDCSGIWRKAHAGLTAADLCFIAAWLNEIAMDISEDIDYDDYL